MPKPPAVAVLHFPLDNRLMGTMFFGNLFNGFGMLLLFSIVFSIIAVRLYQPLILAFIAVGIVLGPSVLNWVNASSEIDLLAKVGVTLLLFIIGLKLDFHAIRTLGLVALATGLGQIIFTAAIVYTIAIVMGLTVVPALYVAIALTFSSTIIIVKLLSDKNEIDSLYGRIAIGYLIVQDIVVVIILIVLSSLHAQHTQMNVGIEILALILKSIGVLTVIAFLSRYALPAFLDWIAKSPELLVLFAIAWAIILACSLETLGLSREVGGFLAGVSLASTEYRHALTSRLDTLRNFLLLFFFLEVGVKLQLHAIYPEIMPVILLSLFVLIGKPIIMMIIMGSMGYRKRTSFLTGITSAQISEFSLILGAVGLSLNHINSQIVGVITLVGLITFALSSYLIIYSHTLYGWIEKYLTVFERKIPSQEDAQETDGVRYDVIIFGIGRYGDTIAKILRSLNLSVLGIDFDPQKIYLWKKRRLDVRYGDAEDIGFVKALPIQHAQWVVSTIPGYESNQILMSALKEAHYRGKTAISVFNPEEVKNEKDIRTDLKLFPYEDAAEKAAEQIAGAIL